jgi:NAD+ kinase
VNFDMQSQTNLQSGDKVEVRQSNKTITFLHPRSHSDYKTLREKLHWNEYPSTF